VRIWSLHPKYLDAAGLVAVWREGLLAQAVLRGATRGYRHHPQLIRFRESEAPVAAIAEYLRGIREEARSRGYQFDGARIARGRFSGQLSVTRGQVQHEWEHLIRKLRVRAPDRCASIARIARPRAHPLFSVTWGLVAAWEKSNVTNQFQSVTTCPPKRVRSIG
jgi:hypothetical protein